MLTHRKYRSEDWSKQWKRKPNLQLISVLGGAWLGSQISCLKLDGEFPHGAIEGALWASTLTNTVSFYKY